MCIRDSIYTVRQATQGFAAYLLTQDEKPSAAISYDSRHKMCIRDSPQHRAVLPGISREPRPIIVKFQPEVLFRAAPDEGCLLYTSRCV